MLLGVQQRMKNGESGSCLTHERPINDNVTKKV